MAINLRWKASLSASCLHAAVCLDQDRPAADDQLAKLLRPAATELIREIGVCRFSTERLLPQLTSLSAEFENNRQLVEAAVGKLYGPDAASPTVLTRLAGCVTDLEAALLRARPQIVEELAVRGRPICEQWEARGPGLLQRAAQLSDESFIVSAADVTLVAPFVGGHGLAHIMENRVTLESVLANPHADLPEVLRLAWLVAQLNFDLPRYSELLPRDRLAQLASLATIPLVLSAAETVELAAYHPASLDRALVCWLGDGSQTPALAERLHRWWEAHLAGESAWHVALAALDAMLDG